MLIKLLFHSPLNPGLLLPFSFLLHSFSLVRILPPPSPSAARRPTHGQQSSAALSPRSYVFFFFALLKTGGEDSSSFLSFWLCQWLRFKLLILWINIFFLPFAYCLGDYKDDDVLRLFSDCGHLFHGGCIAPWLRLNPSCPVRRTSLVPTPISTPLVEVVPLAIGKSWKNWLYIYIFSIAILYFSLFICWAKKNKLIIIF